MKQLKKARIFAIAAHTACGQTRKFSGVPYWYHCKNVVDIVDLYWDGVFYHGKKRAMAAAWLHDTIEDTHVNAINIAAMFNERKLLEYVLGLTKKETNEETNEFLATMCDEIKFIKLADTLANLNDVFREKNKKFAKKFIAKKKKMMNVVYWDEDFGQIQKDVIARIETIEQQMESWN